MVAGEPATSDLGCRIRRLRSDQGLSLARVAEMADLSTSLISQIERGLATPSLDSLRKLASALEVPVFTLFLGELAKTTVVRADERLSVQYPESNIEREILSPNLDGRMVLLHVRFPAGEQSGPQPVHHVGEECIVVIRGALDVLIGDEKIELSTGDSMTFDSELPHILRNPSDVTSEAIVAISPPRI